MRLGSRALQAAEKSVWRASGAKAVYAVKHLRGGLKPPPPKENAFFSGLPGRRKLALAGANFAVLDAIREINNQSDNQPDDQARPCQGLQSGHQAE